VSQVFTWTGDPNATSYQVYIGGVINTTYTTATLSCASGGTCTTPPIVLTAGTSYTWFVAGINSAGEGNWANAPISVPPPSAPPVVPSALAPSGSGATTSQTFSWMGDQNATSYQLYIGGVINTTYTTADLGCRGGGTCTTPEISLLLGSNYTWYVAGINAAGESSFAYQSINVSVASVPVQPSALVPTGSVSTSQVFYWTGDANATSYQLYIGGVVNTSYTTATLGCASGGTCTTPAITLPAGNNLTWYVTGINSAGAGTYADAAIAVSGTSGVPPSPTGLAPSGSATTSQVFTWTGDASATSYQFYIGGVINTTYTSASLGCTSGGTCTTAAIALPAASNLTWYVGAINSVGESSFSYTTISTP
jgi:hypothetical protein